MIDSVKIKYLEKLLVKVTIEREVLEENFHRVKLEKSELEDKYIKTLNLTKRFDKQLEELNSRVDKLNNRNTSVESPVSIAEPGKIIWDTLQETTVVEEPILEVTAENIEAIEDIQDDTSHVAEKSIN